MSDPGGRNAWLTPENLPSGTRTLTVPVPDDLSWVAIFKGAVALLTNADNFEQFGALAPADVAERFMEMFLEIGEDMMPIGTILEFAGATLPDKFLWCNGGAVLIADYLELYQVIGDAYHPGGIGIPENFYLPDKNNRVGMGKNNSDPDFSSLGKKGGSKTVSLTINEMPAHNHGLAFQNLGASGSARPVLQASGSISYTAVQSNGGGQPHQNLPPYITLNYIIKAKK